VFDNYSPGGQEAEMINKTRPEDIPESELCARKYIRLNDGVRRYGLSYKKFREAASEAGALRKITGTILVNTEKFESYLESLEVFE